MYFISLIVQTIEYFTPNDSYFSLDDIKAYRTEESISIQYLMNNYNIQKVVGEGSYGKAILCKRKNDSKVCIIKQISVAKMSRKEAQMTEQEASLLKRMQHPNIVTFMDSFVDNRALHIVMEFADGGDLDKWIKDFTRRNRGRTIPEKDVLGLFLQLSLAIKYIHDRKILHRDLKAQVWKNSYSISHNL